jgi:hypothetical protein
VLSVAAIVLTTISQVFVFLLFLRVIPLNVNNQSRDLLPDLFWNQLRLKFADSKIFSSVAMRGEKRKLSSFREDEWIKGKLNSAEDGRETAFLTVFSGVLPPTATKFRQYKRKRGKAAVNDDVIIQGETERIEFEGHTAGDHNEEDFCQYGISQ